MLDSVELLLNTDYLAEKDKLDKPADTVIYTGPIDKYFNYLYGP